MKVKDCMTKDVVTLKRSTTLTELIQVFRKYNFHTLPVVEENGELVGIVTFEDLLKVFQPYNQDLARMLESVSFVEKGDDDILLTDISPEMGMLVIVDDLMNTNFVTIDTKSSVEEARRLMRIHSSNRLPVVNPEGSLVGIIGLFDIMLAIFKEKGVIS